MINEYPKALYRGGAWDGVSEPDCVVVASAQEQDEQAERGYFPFGHTPPDEAESPASVKIDKRTRAYRNANG